MNIQDSLRRRGLTDTLRLLFLRTFNLGRTPAYLIARKVDLERYDRDHGIETSGVIELDQLDIDSPNREHGTRYGGTSPWMLKEALAKIPIDHSNYTFIDIGSGKGGVLFQASDYPFREIVGVEFAPSLHEIALRNLESFRSRTQKCRKITPICADATQQPLPPGPWVLFFNTPFGVPIWKPVAENIARAKRGPQTSYLIFVNYGWNPGAMEFVRSLSFLEIFDLGETTAIFRFVPESA